ncbi:MAG: 50S ribosomal protein L6 [Proteobacteria bacterium]|nr:50S ribosomal protein L6 [Pseudomonadota bacterium]
MSRVGSKVIPLPSGVQVNVDGKDVVVKGPKGTLSRRIHSSTEVHLDGSTLAVKSVVEGSKAFHGLTRSLLNNMVLGVSNGFSRSLMLVGVGYRAQVKGEKLHMNLGFSHEVVYPLPQGISCTVEKNTQVTLSGIDKELVGQVAANIRAFRKPEPYHGKGVRYADERVSLKAGKSAKK